MGNPFAVADAASQSALLEHFGEEVLIKPRLPGGDFTGKRPDPARPERRVAGLLSSATGSRPISGSVLGHDPRGAGQIAVQPTSLWLSAETVQSLGFDIVTGDAVVCVERSNAAYSVVRPYPGDMGDLDLILAGEDQ
jgi:hypothetical protein